MGGRAPTGRLDKRSASCTTTQNNGGILKIVKICIGRVDVQIIKAMRLLLKETRVSDIPLMRYTEKTQIHATRLCLAAFLLF